MHAAFENPKAISRRALICALLLIIAPLGSVASARNVALNLPSNVVIANVTSARLAIKSGAFGRATVVVLKGGTLTLKNADSVVYRIKIGATLIIVPARGSKTVSLPQRGIFSITCAKVPSLKATLTVK